MEEHEEAGSGATGENATAPGAGGAADGEGSEIERLQAELQARERELEKLRDDALRAMAELENTRRRAARDVENAHKFGLDRLVGELLPVKDSMELGLSAAEGGQDAQAVREGLELTLKMFTDALEKLGVLAVDPAGQKFDPEYHQAMTTVPSAEVPPGTVVAVMQKGYVLNDRLVRPALVSVAKAPE